MAIWLEIRVMKEATKMPNSFTQHEDYHITRLKIEATSQRRSQLKQKIKISLSLHILQNMLQV